jgi:hypothetical protein
MQSHATNPQQYNKFLMISHFAKYEETIDIQSRASSLGNNADF